VYPFAELIRAGHQPTGFWYNPNIQPYREYRQRLEALRQFEEQSGFDIVYVDSYDLEGHLRKVMADLERRCWHCFDMRLSRTAEYARDNGFDAFTTTLLVSPYQNHDFIAEVGAKLQMEYDVRFYGADFEVGYREGKQKAYEMGLYMQKYCGCIFSERERYEKRKKA
jgi:predicted adenine nucleotide alpha hydrolase (AANH) superfamily ATPase